MRLNYLMLLLIVVFITVTTDAYSLSRSDISFSSDRIARGDLILLSIKGGRDEIPAVSWMKKSVSLVYTETNASWHGFIAADLNQKKGIYKVFIRMPSSDFEQGFNIRIIGKDYGLRNLTLPEEKVVLDAESLKRVRKESADVNALWAADLTPPEWNSGFLMPIDGDVVGTFGKRSAINKLERSPHTGIDLRGNTGEPVKAANNGRVVLIADHFFTGNSVYLDHGGGIISMYFHLDKILVHDGDAVVKGQVIGLVGETGRATGPHLHWGMRVNGARVNPLTLIDLSKGLEE